MTTTVKREAPKNPKHNRDVVHEFEYQCILDLADKRHAVGCGCGMVRPMSPAGVTAHVKVNACATIAVCARDLLSYELPHWICPTCGRPGCEGTHRKREGPL